MKHIFLKSLLFSSVFFCLLIFRVDGQVLNTNPGFEDGTWSNNYRPSAQNSTDAVIEVVNSPTRSGGKSLHIQHQYRGSAPTNRCEVMPNTYLGGSTRGYVPWHEEIWLGFSVYLDGWSESLGPWNSIMQVHSIPYNNDWSTLAGPNAWHIYGNDGTFGWTTVKQPHIFIHTKPINNPYTPNPPDALTYDTPLWWTPISNVSNKWVDVVANFIISPDSDGKMRWWINGELVIDFSGPNVYYYDTGGRPAVQQSIVQIGSYKSHTNTNQVSMYFDEIRFGNGNATYQDVAPTGGVPNNFIPVLASVGDQTVIEGNSKSVGLSATDQDGDNLLFSVSPNLDFISLTDNQNGTALLRIDPKAGDAGDYNVTISVTDQKNGIDSKTITIHVEESGQGNSAPILSPIGNKQVMEGEVLNFSLSAVDPEADPLTFSILQGVDFVYLTDNQDGTANVTASPSVGDFGNYELIFKVADSNGNWDSKSIILIVEESSSGNKNPVLASISDKIVTEGNSISVALSASDPEGDGLTFMYSPNLDFIDLTDNQNGTGILSFSPSVGDYGIYNIVVTVKDEFNNFDTESFVLSVAKQENNNSIPIIEPIDDYLITEGETDKFKIKASDAEGDPLTYSLVTSLDFISLLANGNGTAFLTISPEAGDAGKYEITIKVTDPYNGTALETFNLIVNDINWTNTNFINSGGKSVTHGSMLAKEDKYYKGGKAAMRSADFGIAGTDGDEIYQSARYGDFSYEIPVPRNGTYIVRLHFAEITFEEGDIGKRIFNVDIENGQEKLVNYDIIADIGAREASVKTFTGIHVEDGNLTIDLKTVVRNAIISGIEFISESDRVTQLETSQINSELKLYPNPTDGLFTIELNNKESKTSYVPYKILDISGKIVFQSYLTQMKEMVDLRNIKRGLYLLQILKYPLEKILIQ